MLKFKNGRYRLAALLGLCVVIYSGCAYQPRAVEPRVAPSAAVSIAEANAAYRYADSYPSLKGAISLLELYAAQNPADYVSRARLANAYTLLGAGYSQTVAAKAEAYARAMYYGESAMMTVPAYKAARDSGASFEEALVHLGATQFEAMEFWKTALFYDFRECTSLLGKLSSYAGLRQAVAVMDHMEQINRQAMWGNNLFSQGIYYLAQPEFVGGDKQKAAEYLAEAAAVTARNIVPRWGRAKYYAVAMGDVDLYQQDLQWVQQQPLDTLLGYRPWNVFLQREAKALLTETERYFSAS